MRDFTDKAIIAQTPYNKLLAIQVDVFQSEIIDERHFAVDNLNEKHDFYKKYSMYKDVIVVEVPMRD